MFSSLIRRLPAGVCLIVGLSVGSRSFGDESIGGVHVALDQMYAWLATDAETGGAWCRFLESDNLQRQLVLGHGADSKDLNRLCNIYAGDTPGLQRRRFVAVRRALEAWRQELVATADTDLVTAAQQAADRFQPVADARVAGARSSLRDAVAELDRYLAGGGDAKQQGWRTFLKWDDLAGQLADNARADPQALNTIAQQYFSGQEGLERPAFARVRRALLRYLQVVSLAGDKNAKKTYTGQLLRLAGNLKTYNQQPTAEIASQIGPIVQWLDDVGQAPELARLIRRRLSHPNLFFQISEGIVSAAVDRRIDEPTPVTDQILGTTIRGQGVTQADLRGQLAWSCQSVALDVSVDGATTTDTVGYNGPVRIGTAGVTQMAGRKRVLIDAVGFSSLPAEADCQTSTSFCGITTDRCLGKRLIERIAWKRAYRNKSQAEAIAALHAEDRLRARMDDESSELTNNVNRRYAEKIRDPLSRADLFPQQVRLSSTDQAIWLTALQALPAQLGAPRVPDSLLADTEVTMWVHESFVNNSAVTLVGGMTLSDERLVELLEENGRDVPPELQITQDNEPWAITFGRRDPFRITFEDGRVSMKIRAQRFRRGPRDDSDPLDIVVEITAAYHLGVGKLGANLTREGDVDVLFPDLTGRLNAQQIGIKTFMRRKFSALFKEEFIFEGIKLPETLQQRIGQLRLAQASTRDGWFSGGWNRAVDQSAETATR